MPYITDTHVSLPMPYPIALKTFKQNGKDRLISNIDFNVAVTVRSVDSMEGNAGAGVLQVFSAKLNAGNESRTEKVSRISFSISVIYPTAEIMTDSQDKSESARLSLKAYGERLRQLTSPPWLFGWKLNNHSFHSYPVSQKTPQQQDTRSPQP